MHVLRVVDIGFDAPSALLARHGLELVHVGDGAPIPGSYLGRARGRHDRHRPCTPASTRRCIRYCTRPATCWSADPARRTSIHTDASDSLEEEDATCYLQIVLADALPGFGRERVIADMDAWGYSFRLGSARAWFEHDAEDARAFLQGRGLLPEPRRIEATTP